MSDQLANRPESGMERVKKYLLSPEVKQSFESMMGSGTMYYLNQVLIVVANSKDLQECEPKSILIAAMRAASLRLSVDVGQGQAWIIPYKGKASFQMGYKGVYELAQRSGLYRFINMIDVFEGENVIENRMTGMHTLEGHKTSDKITAFILYFQLNNGFEKTFMMTVPEIEEHAQHYSQAYTYTKSKWNDPYERVKMMRKTVLMNGLRRWGRFNNDDLATLDAIDADQGFIDRPELPDEKDTTPPPVVKHTNAELLAELGAEPEPVKVEPPAPASVEGKATEPEPVKAEEPVDNPYADLLLMKSADPVSAFWLLLPRVGLDKKAGTAIAKECMSNFDAAFDKVYAQFVK
jgi:recombination protein RecT